MHGRIADHPEWQDASFAPEVPLVGGERFALPGGTTLRAIHTPGHASNHLCYLLEEEQTLFTGDHVMQASTVVINPPDGDMAAYIASLRGLLDEDLAWLAPGHGFLMAEPKRAHRGHHRAPRPARGEGRGRARGAAGRRPRGPARDGLRRRAGAHAPDGAAFAEGAPAKLQAEGHAEERDGAWTAKR